MTNKNIRYVHHSKVHNFSAAEEMVPYILNLLKSNSVVDVGCGIGTWLKVFADNGVSDYLGIDGDYVSIDQLKIDSNFFVEYDLETLYRSQRKFDLALSLEVAEHLKEESAFLFIKTLTDLSDTIIFSAAIPNQGGQNHLNEQEPSYWISKFEDVGFQCFDILRPIFWENKKVDCWYRQNIFLFTKKETIIEKLKSFPTFSNQHLVHPELLKIKEGVLNSQKNNHAVILSGKKGIRFYFEILFKSLKARI